MRWRKRNERIIKRFALFPIEARIGINTDVVEWRWLEVVYLRQIRGCLDNWLTTRFATKKEYDEYISQIKKEKEE